MADINHMELINNLTDKYEIIFGTTHNDGEIREIIDVNSGEAIKILNFIAAITIIF